jgi:glycosyltransferase involved in cell wall biosynthesis
MQRMTRRLFAELSARVSVTPLCWNGIANSYHLLGERELEYVRTPFLRYKRPASRPELLGENFPGDLGRFLTRPKFDIAQTLKNGDVFIAPDQFSDRRVLKLPQIAQNRRTRFIAIFHDAAGLRLSIFRSSPAQNFRRYLEALAAFDLVICISEESRSDLVDYWSRNKITARARTVVESWPVEFDPVERGATPPRENSPIVLCVSSFTPRKNHLRLLEAADQLWKSGCNFELRLVGSSSGNWGFKVAFEVRRYQALGRPLRWLRHVDDRSLHHAYRECSFTVYPSLMEGFGLPILESLWHGKPCICGGNGAIGETARDGGCLIVDQTSTGHLAEEIGRLLNDETLLRRLSAEARRREFRTWAGYMKNFVGYLRGSTVVKPFSQSTSAFVGEKA